MSGQKGQNAAYPIFAQNMKKNSGQNSKNIPFRPLGVIKDILDPLGAEISYVYEDLVFIKHNHFLLQFGDEGKDLFFYQNTEMSDADSDIQFQALVDSLSSTGFDLEHRGKYSMAENDDGTISISFADVNTE